MKKIFHFLLIVSMVFLVISCKVSTNLESTPTDNIPNTKDAVDVIVMAGQSNMEGHSWSSKLLQNTDTSMHQYYTKGFENTKIMYYSNNGKNKSDVFLPVKLGQGYDTGSFGPEIGIAEELHSRGVEKPIYLIKYALGATSLYKNWNVEDLNSLYHEMVSYVYDQLLVLEEMGYRVYIKGFFWMQGEADAAELISANQVAKYYDNITKLVGSFREEFEEYYGMPERGIAFVDAGISDYKVYKFHSIVNQCKQDFAQDDPDKNYYIDSMQEGLEYTKDNTDYYHFDATSELKLGRLFVSKLLDNEWL